MSNFSDDAGGAAWETPQSPVQMAVQQPLPGGLKAICIIAIILGGLGLMAGLASGAGLILGSALQEALNPAQQDGPAEVQQMQQVQQQMQQEVQALAREFIIPNAAAVILHLFTALLLLMGAIMTLSKKRTGLNMLFLGCASSIFYLIGQRVLDIIFTVKAMPIYDKFGDAIMQEAARGNQGPDMPNVMLIGVVIGIGFTVVWALAEIVFYLFAIFYMRKPNVTALFSSPDAMAKGY